MGAKMDDKHLNVCANNKGGKVFITQESRLLNTYVLGNKGTGKSSLIMKNFAYQSIKDRNAGATFIVSSKDLAFELYVLAKHFKRRIAFINPSVSRETELLINNEFIADEDVKSYYNFEKYIYNNYIVIIDIESLRLGEKGISFAKRMLNQIEKSMINTDITLDSEHYIYVDDAFYYLDCLHNILYYGPQYNISTTLFFQNRNQFKTDKKDYTSFIDSNVKNFILTNSLNFEDEEYYGNVLDIKVSDGIRNRGKIFYSLISNRGVQFNGAGEIFENQDFENIVCEKLHSTKKTLRRKKNKDMKKDDFETKKISSANMANKSAEDKTEVNKNAVDSLGLDINEDILNAIESSNNDNKEIEPLSDIESSLISERSIFDDGKLELSLDWDDDF